MELKQFLLEFAGKTLNKPADELAEALFQMSDDNTEAIKPDALDSLLSFYQNHIQTIKADTSKKFDDGYSKGKSETAKQWEKRLREKFAVFVIAVCLQAAEVVFGAVFFEDFFHQIAGRLAVLVDIQGVG